MKIYPDQRFKGQKALELENELLRLLILPERGSKLASLCYKPKAYELFWQYSGDRFPERSFADPYGPEDSCGMDEMFPGIAESHYRHFPWQGTLIPDHGEVWSIPWQYTIQEERLCLWTWGTRFPYRLAKTVVLEGGRLIIQYEVESLCHQPFHFIWAAHPLFNTCPGMEIRVPAGLDRVINASAGNRLPQFGKEYPFPLVPAHPGESFDLSRIPDKNGFGFQKYYFAAPAREGWAALYHPEQDLEMRVEFPAEQVPWLGVWVNEGGWSDQYNVALEPCTGAMDSPILAEAWERESVLGPGEKRQWSLTIAVE